MNKRNDIALAELFFDTEIAPSHKKSGVPEDGLSYMKKSYVAEALVSPEAMRQLRVWQKKRRMKRCGEEPCQ